MVADRPVWLSRVDGHAGWANSKAMEMAGVTAQDRRGPAGGRIMRVAGAAKVPIRGVRRQRPVAGRRGRCPIRARKTATSPSSLRRTLLLKRGVTAVADMGIGIEDWQSYRRAGDAGNLRIRIMAYAGSVRRTWR